jgi:hypothetical protein
MHRRGSEREDEQSGALPGSLSARMPRRGSEREDEQSQSQCHTMRQAVEWETNPRLKFSPCHIECSETKEPFGWNYKPAEKHCWLIFCERKILFWLKNKLNKTDYKPDEHDLIRRTKALG